VRRVVATAGHVDHGKSTLVRALTGMEPDRLAEERRRGLTVDLGFAWTRLPSGTDLAFVDVPGHERFVGTMLAGVGPVPAAVLVVAADEGWMPQSGEHLDALDALDVRHGLLVVTRCDLLDPALAREEAVAEIARSSLGAVPVVEVCAPGGQGLDAVRTALDALVAAVPEPDPTADVRFWVDRAFSVRGAGTVVTGTLGAGTVAVGDELDLAGAEFGARRVAVRGLQSLGEPVAAATGVARLAVNLRGVPRDAVERGDALVTPGAWLGATEVDVAVRGVRDRDPGPLSEQLMLHVGSVAIAVRVRPLGPAHARLRADRPLPLRIGDRAVLRDPGRRAVAAGIQVLDVRPPPLNRRGAAARRAAVLAAPDRLPGDDPPPAPFGTAAGELSRRGVVRAADLVAMGVPRAEVAAASTGSGPQVPAANGWLLDPARVPAILDAVAAGIRAHDEADPLDPGLPVEAARRLAELPDPGLLTAVVALRLPSSPAPATTSRLLLRDGRVQLDRAPGTTLPGPLTAALERLRADLTADPFAAPDAARLAELGLGRRELATLLRAGLVLAVADGVVLLPDAPDRALEVLRGIGPTFTAADARHALGTSRRVAVPLLELLARTGHTRRTNFSLHTLL